MNIYTNNIEDYFISGTDEEKEKSRFNLNDAVKNINNIFEHKITHFGLESNIDKSKRKKFDKIRSSFVNSMSQISKNIDDIYGLDRISDFLYNVSEVVKIDKQNKNLDEINKKCKEINKNISSLRNELTKQTIRNLQNSKKVSSKLRSYNSMMPSYEQLSNNEQSFVIGFFQKSSNIRYIPKDKKSSKERLRKNVIAEEKKIDEKYDKSIEYSDNDIKKLFDDMNNLQVDLHQSKNKKLNGEIKTEVTSIKRVIKPKTMSISKEYIEKMRKSDKLITDLQILNKNNFMYYFGKNKKGKLIENQLEQLKELISETISLEEKNKHDLDQRQINEKRNIDIASQAINTYKSILDKSIEKENISTKTDNENDEINMQINELEGEKSKYTQTHGDSYSSEYEVVGSDVYERKQEIDNSKEIAEYNKQINEQKQKIKINKEHEEMIKKQNLEIPEAYKNMKDKLNSQSNLKKGIFVNTYNGGMKL